MRIDCRWWLPHYKLVLLEYYEWNNVIKLSMSVYISLFNTATIYITFILIILYFKNIHHYFRSFTIHGSQLIRKQVGIQNIKSHLWAIKDRVNLMTIQIIILKLVTCKDLPRRNHRSRVRHSYSYPSILFIESNSQMNLGDDNS